MTPADLVTAIARWFLLLSIVTAATVAFFRVAGLIGGWSFAAMSPYLIAAPTVGCLVVTAAKWAQALYTNRPSVIGLPLPSVYSPTHVPQADQAEHMPAPANTEVRSAVSEPLEDLAPRVRTRGEHDGDQGFEERRLDAVAVPFEADVEYKFSSIEDHSAGPSFETLPGENGSSVIGLSQTSPVAPERRASSIESPPNSDQIGNVVDDAERMADALNLYERIGFLPDEPVDKLASAPNRADDLPPQQGLWNELVDEYGAASIDFQDDGSGGCVITLGSGNVVFYAPERGCWIWIIFDRTEPAPRLRPQTSPRACVDADPC